jgi:hypothetical protein
MLLRPMTLAKIQTYTLMRKIQTIYFNKDKIILLLSITLVCCLEEVMKIISVFLISCVCIFIALYIINKTPSIRTYNFIDPNDLLLLLKEKKKVRRFFKKTEKEFRRIIEELFKRKYGGVDILFPSCRPDFLRNPKTGKNLELDMYCPLLNLAFEYQGIQHRKFTKMFHKSMKDFYDQIDRDQYKKYQCQKLGIKLICISDMIKPTEENVIKLLRENRCF